MKKAKRLWFNKQGLSYPLTVALILALLLLILT